MNGPRFAIAVLVFSSFVLRAEEPPSGDRQHRVLDSISADDLAALARRFALEDLVQSEVKRALDELRSNPHHLEHFFSNDELMKMFRGQGALPSAPTRLPTRMMEVLEQQAREQARQLLAIRPETAPSQAKGTTPEPIPPQRPFSRQPPRGTGLDPRLQNNPSVRNMLRIWERNFGPLDRSPALKKAVAELLNSSIRENAAAGGPSAGDLFSDFINPDSPLGQDLAQWLDRAANGPGWDWNEIGLGDLNLSLKLPDGGMPEGLRSIGGPSGIGSDDTPSVYPVLLAIAAIAIIAALIVKRSRRTRSRDHFADGLQTEPVDVNTITDRATLIRAFEQTARSVFGRSADFWNHARIAESLAHRPELAAAAHDAGKLYCLARYAPPDEKLDSAHFELARQQLGSIRSAVAS